MTCPAAVWGCLRVQGHPNWVQGVSGSVFREGGCPVPAVCPGAQSPARPPRGLSPPPSCPQMLATLLITRQFLQNIREVLQPHLYRRLGRGELGLRAAWELARALLGLLSLRRPARHLEPQAEEGVGGSSGGGGRRCLSGACGAPEEEEEATMERRPAGEGGEGGDGPRGGREEEEEDEDEDEDEEEEEEEDEGEEGGLLDCGLRLKKVSFAERGAGRRRLGPSPEALLEEGSPTMVEKGLEAGVFTLAEEDDEAEGAPSSPEREPPAVLLRRARGEGRDQGPDGGPDPEPGLGDSARKQRRQNRSSWIDPPEEEHSAQLTQAELESCMKKYEVRRAPEGRGRALRGAKRTVRWRGWG